MFNYKSQHPIRFNVSLISGDLPESILQNDEGESVETIAQSCVHSICKWAEDMAY